MLYKGLTEDQIEDLRNNLSVEELLELEYEMDTSQYETLMTYLKLLGGVVVIAGLVAIL